MTSSPSRWLTRALVALTCSIGTLLVISPPALATAGDPVYNSSTLVLTNHPRPTMHTVCRTRTISLGHAYYHWGHSVYRINGDGSRTAEHLKYETIRLESGDYTWLTCLNPRDGYYLMSSRVETDGYRPAFYATTFTLASSGTYQYLGFLYPVAFIEN